MDSIGDLLSRIKNGYLAYKKSVVSPASKMRVAVLQILKKYKYISDFSVKDGEIEIILQYENGKPRMQDVKRVSKPGLRIYAGFTKFPRVMSGYGICIISTSKGVISDKEAKKMKVGGEVLCKVW
jgi:small subunit ribosomal protein S8